MAHKSHSSELHTVQNGNSDKRMLLANRIENVCSAALAVNKKYLAAFANVDGAPEKKHGSCKNDPAAI